MSRVTKSELRKLKKLYNLYALSNQVSRESYDNLNLLYDVRKTRTSSAFCFILSPFNPP